MAVEFGRSGTIYDAPPVHTEVFNAGAADLNVPMGGGFQAAHIWVNNRSNGDLYLPDGPDVVPAGATRVIAIQNTDVARASWKVPANLNGTQATTGGAIIIWLNAGIDISPTPGVTNNPIVTIAANQSVAVTAINSTVTVAGTINIANTPTVNIGNTPTVNIGNTPTVTIGNTVAVTISSGTVSIGNTAQVNIASQSVTLQTAQSQVFINSFNADGTLRSINLDPKWHVIAIKFEAQAPTFIVTVSVKGHSSGVEFTPVNLRTFQAPSGAFWIAIPIISENTNNDTQLDITINSGGGSYFLYGVLDAGFATQAFTSAGQVLDVAVKSYLGTYSFGNTTALAPAAAATDVVVLVNPAGSTKIVKITRFRVEGVQTTAGVLGIAAITRSADDTGGIFTAYSLAGTQHDKLDAAPVAVIRGYTANPTALGAIKNTLRSQRLYVPTATGIPKEADWDFGTRPAKPVILRPGELFALNLVGNTAAGGSLVFFVEWTEETGD